MSGEEEKKELKPLSETIQISTRKNANFYVYLGKRSMEQHGHTAFHALGMAVPIAVVAAENLVR